MVRKAIEYYTKALELAARPNKIKDHISTNANLSMCYTLLGEYDEAYNISEVSSTSVTEDDSLLKSKAAAAYYKGFYSESAELLSKVHDVTCQDIINSVLALLQSNEKNKEKKALALIEESLSSDSFKAQDLDFVRCLKFDTLLSLKDLGNAKKVLKELETSTLPEWQKERVRGDYYGIMNDDDKTDTHYQKALKHHDIDVSTKIVIADYYYIQKCYETCFDICSSIPIESIKSGLYIFQRLLRMLIVSSFNIPKLDKCREYITYGKQQKIKDSYLYEISATIYWQEDELELARDELFTVLEKDINAKNPDLFSNYALVSFMLGDFKTARKYFSMSEKMSGFYDNTNIVKNCIITLIVIGNKIEAKRIFEKALEIKFEDKDDTIHKFAPVFYLRENNANLFAKYAIEFNKKHGDTAWLWKKDIKKDEEELKAIFNEGIRHSIEIRKWYLKSPVPLVFLPSLLWKREIIHLWSFNREYEFPIFLESGNPKELKDEISTLSKEKSILVDYTALLTLQEAGSEHLWLLENAFDEIYIYRPMYLQMLNELMFEEHNGLREVIKFISESKKIKFLKRVKVKKLNIKDEALANLIQEEYSGLFQTAQGKRMVLLVGEARLKGFAHSFGIVSCGIRSLLEYTKQENIIDNQDKQKAIVNLIKKDCRFISFDRETLEYLCEQYSLEEFKNIFNKLGNQIFLSGSEIESFIKVYCEFINKHISIISDSQIIKCFIKKTISDIKILTFRARVFYIYPFLKRDNVLTDIDEITLYCVRYIYYLTLTIYASEIDEVLKSEYIEVIKKEANLAFWSATSEFNCKSIIRRILEKAKQDSEKKRMT
jgi:tetratricopeptide (TPR) repeat protein